MSGHVWIPNKYSGFDREHDVCNLCFYTKNFFKIFSINLTCAEIIKINTSHDWKNYKTVNNPNICKCSCCNLVARELTISNKTMVRIGPYSLYTCNEYLMIKANE